MRNIQILLETVVRCGGNCSGCALSSSERMTKSDFDFTSFKISVSKINSYLKERVTKDNIESLSLFLGQGDHFLLTDNELKEIVSICEDLVPIELKHKTVILLTASAIGKHSEIKRKMDLIYDESTKLGIPMFIQTVFDPKKFVETKNFKDVYMDNILYFKNKCGMTDLTINLGVDFIEQMSPKEFHDWVVEYGFNHVEVNWVINKNTQFMWEKYSNQMSGWLKEWMLIYKKQPSYEINYIPISSRILSFKNLPLIGMANPISESLEDNLYVDNLGNLIPCQMGPINNLTPVQERLSSERIININHLLTGKQIEQEIKKISNIQARKMVRKIMGSEVCLDCQYQSSCAISGSATWLDYQGKNNGCPWGVDALYSLIEEEFSDKTFKNTAFSKNPVQNESLKKEGNEISSWFDKEVEKRITYEK